jgi:hypothetical protein
MVDLAAFENWQCQHCGLGAHSTVLLRAGPGGDKTLCNTCGLSWSVHGGVLPVERLDLFRVTPVVSASGADVQMAAATTAVEGSVKDDEQEVGTPSGISGSSVGTPAFVSEVGA